MRFILILASVLTFCGAVRAEPMHLACHGEMRAPPNPKPERYTLTIVLDTRKQTISTEHYGSAPFIDDKPEDETVAFLNQTKMGISTGTINRYSGELSLHILIADGLLTFNGTCTRAERLF
jgi:hypothetical protein